MQDQHTEVSRRSPNLFSVTEVAARIGADLETVMDWVEIGAIDRAVFGGGRFSKNELLRAALVFELVKFGLSSSCARDIVREMEYDLQQIWEGIPRHFKAYAIVILACTRFRRHRVRCFYGTGGELWRDEGLRGSSSLRLCA